MSKNTTLSKCTKSAVSSKRSNTVFSETLGLAVWLLQDVFPGWSHEFAWCWRTTRNKQLHFKILRILVRPLLARLERMRVAAKNDKKSGVKPGRGSLRATCRLIVLSTNSAPRNFLPTH